MLRSQHILRLIIAGLVLAYVAIAAVQYSQYRSVEAVMRRGDVNALWSFLQLNVEYEKLDHALHQFELDPTSITMDKLELRYDLFLSRFSALESGTSRTLMQDEPIYSTALAALQRFVAAGDSYFGASVDATSSQTNMRRLRIDLDGLRETVQELSLSASRVSALLGDSRNAEVKHQTLLTTGLTAFQALLTFLLAFAMARQFLQREKAAAQAMAAQNELVDALKRNEEVLEARVAERTVELQKVNAALREHEDELEIAHRLNAELQGQPAGDAESPQAPPHPAPAPSADDALRNIPGLDVTAGLRRVLDKRPAYEGLLRKFVAGQAHAVQATRTALAAGQHDEAQRAMHTLKGTAGTIGASALAALAQRAEEAIAQKTSPELIEPLLEPVEAACRALVTALQQALPADEVADADTGPGLQIDAPAARALVAQLDALLSDDDSDAIEIFKDSAPALQALLGPAYGQMKRSLDSYDFVEALAILRQTPIAHHDYKEDPVHE
eukprot:gene3520-3446_t